MSQELRMLTDKTLSSGNHMANKTNNGWLSTSMLTQSKTESSQTSHSESSQRWAVEELSQDQSAMSWSKMCKLTTPTKFSSSTHRWEVSSQEKTTASLWKLVRKAETDIPGSQMRRISGINISRSRVHISWMREDLCSTSQEQKIRTTQMFFPGRSTRVSTNNGESIMSERALICDTYNRH